MTFEQNFASLSDHFQETARLESINNLLGWDERTKLPKAGAEFRGDQMAYLSGLIHARQTDSKVEDWLAALEGTTQAKDRNSDAGATIYWLRRDFDRNRKIPQRLVEELTRATIRGQQAWVTAREADDFSLFAPELQTILGLLREKADAIDHGTCRYDALLDEYEPLAKTSEVATVLGDLASKLSAMVQEIQSTGKTAPIDILRRRYPVPGQECFGRSTAEKIGFDFNAGRIDVTHHPFCAGIAPGDCRITTRYDEQFFSTSFFGTLHEAGHGMYEQGLRADQFGLPPGSYASLGIHESQSRMWENHVGRSLPFWESVFPQCREAFPDALADVALDDFYWAVNDVRPSLIRVEADEATYNLHIVIRFELEQALIDDDLTVADLPAAWKEKYRQYLGIEPPSDADGVLQDVHWSMAAFGYFSTYSLGNLYASQMFEQAHQELGDLNEQFRQGDFLPLREWLRQQVHTHGRCYSAGELIEKITGKPLSSQPLLDYLAAKLRPLYGLD